MSSFVDRLALQKSANERAPQMGKGVRQDDRTLVDWTVYELTPPYLVSTRAMMILDRSL